MNNNGQRGQQHPYVWCNRLLRQACHGAIACYDKLVNIFLGFVLPAMVGCSVAIVSPTYHQNQPLFLPTQCHHIF